MPIRWRKSGERSKMGKKEEKTNAVRALEQKKIRFVLHEYESKQAMSGIPNVEPVTLLIILFALELPRETPGAVTVFLVLQGVLYGFGLWWAMYLYVWYLLAVLAWLLRRMDNAFGWAVFSGAYGLCFGGLCAAVYLVAKTPAFALSWWLSGLSYDVMHGAGNFVIMLLLYRPLRTALQTAKRQIRL